MAKLIHRATIITAYLTHENITIRHMKVKINILKPETNKKLKIISNLSTVVVKEHVYVRVLSVSLQTVWYLNC